MKTFSLALLLTTTLTLAIPSPAATREEKVRGDLKEVEATGLWIYNDLNKGITQANQSGKPLLVVFRCIP